MKISKVLIIVAVLAIAAYFLMNGMKSGSGPDKAKPGWFSKLDANGDGKISPEELRAYGIPDSEFIKWDKNGDGYISQEEMKTYGG